MLLSGIMPLKALHIRLDGQALSFYSNGGREGLVPISRVKQLFPMAELERKEDL